MRNIFFISLFFLQFICCQKNNSSEDSQKESQQSSVEHGHPKFQIDSIAVVDSVRLSKTLALKYSCKVLEFPSIKHQTLLDSIYNPINIKLVLYDKQHLLKAIEQKKKEFFKQNETDALEYSPDYDQVWEENTAMNVHSHKNNLLTLSYSMDVYSGGAHGYYSVTYKNIDLQQSSIIALESIFNKSNTLPWDQLLRKYFKSKEQKEMLLVDEISPNHNFYFDNTSITFVYNPYEITAFAAGIVEIRIPFSEVKKALKRDFVKRYGIK